MSGRESRGLRLGDVVAKEPWGSLQWRVTKGEHPTKEELANAIRTNPNIPPDIAHYVAGRFDGSIRRPLGRPAKRDTERNRRARADFLYVDVAQCQAAFRIQGIPRPREKALRIVAKRNPMASGSPETLRDQLKLVRHPLPIERVEKLVRRMEADGTVRLDPREGLVWLQQDEAETA